MARVKIFQIGFNKCGTVTLSEFFKSNGLPAKHWAQGDIARQFEASRLRNEDPFSTYQKTIVFTDMMDLEGDRILESYKHFDYIYRFYPDALFILNTRNCSDWIKSRFRHGKFWERYRIATGLKDEAEVAAHWRAEWFAHHHRVLEFFKDKPKQLLYFDIDKDGPEQLAEFVKDHYRVDPAHYVARNVTGDPGDKPARREARLERQNRPTSRVMRFLRGDSSKP